jgi:hypothetical protein
MEIKNWIVTYVPEYLSNSIIESQGNRNLNKHVGTLKEALDSIDVALMIKEDREVYDLYYRCQMYDKTLFNVTFYLNPTLTVGADVVGSDLNQVKIDAVLTLKERGYDVKIENFAYATRKYFTFKD